MKSTASRDNSGADKKLRRRLEVSVLGVSSRDGAGLIRGGGSKRVARSVSSDLIPARLVPPQIRADQIKGEGRWRSTQRDEEV